MSSLAFMGWKPMHFCSLLLLFLLLAAWPSSARAVINLPLTLFDTSGSVARLKITQATAANKVIDAEVIDVVKGELAAKTLRIQLALPAGLFETVKAGDEMVIFPPRRGDAGVLHVADHWVVVQLDGQSGAWKAQGEKPEFYRAFPGTTAALSQLCINRKAGKDPLLEKLDENAFFAGKAIELGNGPKGASRIWTVSSDNSGKSTALVVQTPAGLKAFKLAEKLGEEIPATAPAEPADPAKVSGRFDAASNANAQFAVTSDSITLSYPKPGNEKPTAQTADFMRLTGQSLADFDKNKKGLQHAAIARLDINGDGRDDALILADDIGFLLVNRGYGCFFAAELSARNLRESAAAAGVKIGPGTVWTVAHYSSAKSWDVILLSAEGKMIVVPGEPSTK